MLSGSFEGPGNFTSELMACGDLQNTWKLGISRMKFSDKTVLFS